MDHIGGSFESLPPEVTHRWRKFAGYSTNYIPSSSDLEAYDPTPHCIILAHILYKKIDFLAPLTGARNNSTIMK